MQNSAALTPQQDTDFLTKFFGFAIKCNQIDVYRYYSQITAGLSTVPESCWAYSA